MNFIKHRINQVKFYIKKIVDLKKKCNYIDLLILK